MSHQVMAVLSWMMSSMTVYDITIMCVCVCVCVCSLDAGIDNYNEIT